MRRGILYIVWGDQIERVLERSRRSLAQHHSDLPVEVVRLAEASGLAGLLHKPRMMALSPFEETLFLDADTVVLGALDFGFEKAARFGLACAINECPWARRYQASITGEVIEYNTGVLFFTRAARPLFDAWERLTPRIDSSIRFVQDGQLRTMPCNDQAAFALAVEETGFAPFVLPLNWNYRPRWYRSFFGPLKIWHDYQDPPADYVKLTRYYDRPDAIIQFTQTRG